MKISTLLRVLFVTVLLVDTITAQCGFTKNDSVSVPYFTGASVYIEHDFPADAVSYEITRTTSADEVFASFQIEGETQEELDNTDVWYSVQDSKILISVKGSSSVLSDAGRLAVVPLGLVLGVVSLVLVPTYGAGSRSFVAVLVIAILAVSVLPEGGIAQNQTCTKLRISLSVPEEVSVICIGEVCVDSSPTPSPQAASSSPSTSVTPLAASVTPTPSVTPSASPSSSVTPSVTPSPASPSVTPSISPSNSVSPSPSPSSSVSPSSTPSPVSPSSTPSISVSPSSTPSVSVSPTPSRTPSMSRSPSPSRTPSRTPSVSPSNSRSPSSTPSASPSPVSPSSTPSITPSPSVTPSPVPVCGDGLLQVGEACDDGNLLNGDCCSSSCVPQPGCESEPNNQPSLANGPLTLPFNYSGSLRPSSQDEDWFKFTLSAATTLSIFGSANFTDNMCGPGSSMTPYNAAVDWGMEIRDASGTLVYSLSSGNGYCPAAFQGPHLLAGTYSVRIYADGTSYIPEYRLYIFALATCGNGAVEPGEYCEPPTAHCNTTSCLLDPYCGNGVIESSLGEICDDGNGDNGDCCSAICNYTNIKSDCEMEPNNNCTELVSSPLPLTVAGYVRYPDNDYFLFSTGPTSVTVNFLGGDNVFNTSCTRYFAGYYIRLSYGNNHCGQFDYFASENFMNYGTGYCPNITRKLDPGLYTLQIVMSNQGVTLPYFVNASIIATCGNGIIEANEVCEPPTLHCNPITCVWDPFCGDGGINQVSELCDDGNTKDGDCCSSQCDYTGVLDGCEREPNDNCNQLDASYSDTYPLMGTGLMRRGTIVNSGKVFGYKDYDYYGFRTDAWSTVRFVVYNSFTNQTCNVPSPQQTTAVSLYRSNCTGTTINTNSVNPTSGYCSSLNNTNLIPPGNYTFSVRNACGYWWNVTEYQVFANYKSYCGNGIIEAPETCDSPNAPCYNCALCGNGILESEVEVCDDGNTNAGDGCSPTCSQIEPGWICNQIYNDTYTTCTVPLAEIEPNSDCTTATSNRSSNGNMFAWNATMNPGEVDMFTLFINKTGWIVVELAVYARGSLDCPTDWGFSTPSSLLPTTNIADSTTCSNSPSNGGSQVCFKTTYTKTYFSAPTFTFKLTGSASQVNPVEYMALIQYQR